MRGRLLPASGRQRRPGAEVQIDLETGRRVGVRWDAGGDGGYLFTPPDLVQGRAETQSGTLVVVSMCG